MAVTPALFTVTAPGSHPEIMIAVPPTRLVSPVLEMPKKPKLGTTLMPAPVA